MSELRILFYDIETTHNITAQFDLRDEYTPHTNILQERYVVCAAWQWLGEKKVHTVATIDDPKLFKANPHNDYHVIKTLHDVLSQADVIVAHNGDAFDKRYIETRILFHGLPALPPIASIDTYKVAKSRFKFNSNRLDYLGKFLGFGGKKDTPAGLWLEVLKGNAKAIQVMVDYNKRDVTLLRDIFLKLRPYMSNHINRELFSGLGCPRCGSHKIQSRGFHRAISKVYRRFQCQTCSGWFKADKAEPLPKTTKRVL
jgi:hypothetical protein